jgi:hypothetical protein
MQVFLRIKLDSWKFKKNFAGHKEQQNDVPYRRTNLFLFFSNHSNNDCSVPVGFVVEKKHAT